MDYQTIIDLLFSSRAAPSLRRHYVLAREPEGASLIRKVSSALQGMDELQDAFRCPSSDKRTSYYRCMESEILYTSEGGN